MSPWAFNLRSADVDSSDDSDSEINVPTTCIAAESCVSDSLHDLDISTRAETAKYKPNPWTIAKINALSRRTAGAQKSTTETPTIDARSSLGSGKGLGRQHKATIPDFFNAQAQLRAPQCKTRSPARPIVAPSGHRPDVASGPLGQQTPSDSGLQGSSRRGLTHTAHQQSGVPVPNIAEAVSPSCASARAIRCSPSVSVSVPFHSFGHAIPRSLSPSLSRATQTRSFLAPLSSPLPRIDRLAARPNAHACSSPAYPYRRFPNAFLPRVSLRERPSFPNEGKQDCDVDGMESSTCATPAFTLAAHTESADPPHPNNTAPHHVIPLTSPRLRLSSQDPPAAHSCSHPDVAPPPRRKLPSKTMALAPAAPAPSCLNDDGNSLSDPDAQWSTLPSAKRNKNSNDTRARLGGRFRVPGVAQRRQHQQQATTNSVKAPRRRVILYRPPPLPLAMTHTDESDGMPNLAAPEASSPTPCRDVGSLSAAGLADDAGGRAPQSSHYSADENDALSVVVDTPALIAQYPRAKSLMTERRRRATGVWDLLGLESCGVVHGGDVGEVSIVSWQGGGHTKDNIDVKKQ